MEPRGFFGTWCTIFALTGLPFGVLMSTVGGMETEDGLAAGFGFGVLFGVCMAPLMMSVKVRLPLGDRSAFVSKLNVSMAELAYHPKTQAADYIIFEAVSAGAYKLGPLQLTPSSFFTVFVQLDGDGALIVGPRQTVRKLEKRLGPAVAAYSAHAA
jgi:hypothetical protein